MADIDLKTLTPDTSINDSAVLFGADSQASSSPSVYAVSTVRQHIVGTANTFTQPQIVSVSSSSDALRITQTGAGNALVVEDSANPDSTPFVVDANGNVGVGRSPTTRLDVYTASASDTYIRAANTAATSGFDFGVSGGGDSFVYNRNNTPIIFGTNSSERMRITSAGRVGIGTSSPGAELEVADSSGDNDVRINLRANASQTSQIGASSTLMFFDSVGAKPIAFITNSTERMRIDSSGNILVGTTLSPTTGTQTLTVETGTAPTATPADTISVYSSDLSAGNTMLSIYTEGTSVNANTTADATHRIAVRINGTVYYLLANTAA